MYVGAELTRDRRNDMRFDGDPPGPLQRAGDKDAAPEDSYWLDPADLVELVRLGPLVSIDLVVRDGEGRILVGLRNNEPAKDAWFVPGGRVGKGESLDKAFRRIVKQELGIVLRREESRFLGVFEHFYETNFLQHPDLGTHYVVLAHLVEVVDAAALKMDDQHRQVRWLTPKELTADPHVHRNTKVYGPLSATE